VVWAGRARVIRLDLPALHAGRRHNAAGLLTAAAARPLRYVARLDYYPGDLVEILRRSSQRLGVEVDSTPPGVSRAVRAARRASAAPAARVRDFAQVERAEAGGVAGGDHEIGATPRPVEVDEEGFDPSIAPSLRSCSTSRRRAGRVDALAARWRGSRHRRNLLEPF